jgi:hypothetical protein
MKTLNLGIEMDAGTDFSLVIGISGDSGPIDLTGYSFLSEMRSTTDPTAPVVAEFDFTILDQATNQGQVKMSLPLAEDSESEITTSIANPLVNCRLKTPFLFDVKMKDTAGNVSRPIQGIIYVCPEATQEVFS